MFFGVFGKIFDIAVNKSKYISKSSKTSSHSPFSQGSTLFFCWCLRVKRKHEAEFHCETVEAKGLFMTALQIHDGILHHRDCSGLITHLYHADKLAFLLRLHAFEKKKWDICCYKLLFHTHPGTLWLRLIIHQNLLDRQIFGGKLCLFTSVSFSLAVFGPAASFSRNIPQGDQCYAGYVLYELKPELLPPVTLMLTTPSAAPQFPLPPRFP